VPGFVLAPSTTYAFVVFNTFSTAEGGPLQPSDLLVALARGERPTVTGIDAEALAANYAPLWPVLTAGGYNPATVAAATVFTTGDTTLEMFELSEELRTRFDLLCAIKPTDMPLAEAMQRGPELLENAVLSQSHAILDLLTP
jgi:hypothetical protein